MRLRFRTEAPPAAELAASHDLVVAADGVHSATREAHARHFRPTVTHHRNRYIWLAVDFAFDAFRFEIAETGHGVMQLHAYPFALPSPGGRSPTGVRGPADGSGASTVIVEMRDEVWRAAGFDSCGTAESAERCAKVFADALGGRPLRSNKSSWLTFATVTNQHWSHGRTVLLGDAAHTAHFSIGSGTKLAVEDALALAACIEEQPDLPAALAAYEAERRPVVLSTQRAAAASLRWFEELRSTRTSRPGGSPSTSSPAAAASPTTTSGSATPVSPERSRRSSAARPAPRRCSPRCGSAASNSATGSSCRPWTCTPPPPTACPATSTSSTSAPGRSAVPVSS